MGSALNLHLPYPPSMNHYWRRVGDRTLVSRPGRSFRARVVQMLTERRVRSLAGRLEVRLAVHPPDHRRRDLDNLLKPLLDAMQHGGLYADDGQIDRLEACRLEPVEDGLVMVWARPFRMPAEEIEGWVMVDADGRPAPGSFHTDIQQSFLAARRLQRLGGRASPPLYAAEATLTVFAERHPMTSRVEVQS